MVPNKMKEYINNASYGQLLHKWRFASSGDPFFQGEIGDYYKKVMFKKRDQLSHKDQIHASKVVGLGLGTR